MYDESVILDQHLGSNKEDVGRLIGPNTMVQRIDLRSRFLLSDVRHQSVFSYDGIIHFFLVLRSSRHLPTLLSVHILHVFTQSIT